MKRNLMMTTLVIAGAMGSSLFGQSQYPPTQGDPRYNGQYDDGRYDDGRYNDNGDYEGVYAPAPPPMPRYAYSRPPIPGPQYYWVDGYWNFYRGRYVWVSGYWMLPPYQGGYWVAPRYNSGRFFVGFWGGGPRDYRGGFVRGGGGFRPGGNVVVVAPRPVYRNPGYNGPGHRGNHGGYDRRGRR